MALTGTASRTAAGQVPHADSIAAASQRGRLRVVVLDERAELAPAAGPRSSSTSRSVSPRNRTRIGSRTTYAASWRSASGGRSSTVAGMRPILADVTSRDPVSELFDPQAWREVEGFADLTDLTYHRCTRPGPAGGTVRIAFDRPEVRNAFRPHTVDELYRALDHARRTPDVGVGAAHRQRAEPEGRRLGLLLRRRPADPRAQRLPVRRG